MSLANNYSDLLTNTILFFFFFLSKFSSNFRNIFNQEKKKLKTYLLFPVHIMYAQVKDISY